MSEEQTARAVYRRNGNATSSGDPRFTLDPDATSGVEETEWGPFLRLPDGAGMGLKKNLYLPDGWNPSSDEAETEDREEVDHYVIEVSPGTPHVAEATAEAGSAEPISDEEMLARNGETEALADLLASIYDGVGKVTAEKIAEQRVQRHQ